MTLVASVPWCSEERTVPLTVSVQILLMCGICGSAASLFWWLCVLVTRREAWSGYSSHLSIYQDIQGANACYHLLLAIGSLFCYFSLMTTKSVSSQLVTQLGNFQHEWSCVERNSLYVPRWWASKCVLGVMSDAGAPNSLHFVNPLAR